MINFALRLCFFSRVSIKEDLNSIASRSRALQYTDTVLLDQSRESYSILLPSMILKFNKDKQDTYLVFDVYEYEQVDKIHKYYLKIADMSFRETSFMQTNPSVRVAAAKWKHLLLHTHLIDSLQFLSYHQSSVWFFRFISAFLVVVSDPKKSNPAKHLIFSNTPRFKRRPTK